MSRSVQRGAVYWWLALPMAALAVWWWWADAGASSQAAARSGVTPAPSVSAVASPGPAVRGAAPGSAPSRTPLTEAAQQARRAQAAMWQQRLERAQRTLHTYAQATRYPHGSRPAAEHADQLRPDQPIDEEHAFRMPGGKAVDGVRLRTTQERIFVQGDEGVRLTVSLHDDEGRTLPLRIVRAVAREMPPPNSASLYPQVPMNFNDEGADGDAVAGDRVFGVLLRPSAQGFDGLFGQVRVEAFLQYRSEPGFAYFDVMVTPQPPATWAGGVRDAVEDGSLVFRLPVQVREPGRYVITGRVDDSAGKPLALLTFNDELNAGAQEVRLTLFGKLVHDAKPAFPLGLRDVNGFLLRPDAFPDRMLMPRLSGAVHTSGDHPLAALSDAEWSGEERQRYLAELQRDVDAAKLQLERLGR